MMWWLFPVPESRRAIVAYWVFVVLSLMGCVWLLADIVINPRVRTPEIQVVRQGDFECVSLASAKEWTCTRVMAATP